MKFIDRVKAGVINWLGSVDVQKDNRGSKVAASFRNLFFNLGLNREVGAGKLKEFERIDSAIATAVRVISTAMLPLPIKVQRIEYDKGKQIFSDVDNHPVIDLLNEPNPLMDFGDLKQHFVQSFISMGRCHISVEKTSGVEPAELYPLESDLIQQRLNQRGIPIGFRYGTPDNFVDYKMDEMIFIRHYNINNIFDGAGFIEPILPNLESTSQAIKYNNMFFKNGHNIGGVLTPENDIQADQVELIKKAAAANHQGVNKSHGIFVMPVAGKYEAHKPNMSDMQFIDGMKLNQEKIYGLIGIPPVLAGVLEHASYANAFIQEVGFWRNGAIPLVLNRLQSALTRQLLWRHYGDRDHRLIFDLANVEALKGDKLKTAQTASILVRADIKTRDEIRQETYGLEPHPDGRGAEPFTQTNPTGGAAPAANPDNAPRPDKSAMLSKDFKSESFNLSWWRHYDTQTKARAPRYETVIAKHFDNQKKRVLAKLDDLTGNGKFMSMLFVVLKQGDLNPNDANLIYDLNEENKQLLELVKPTIPQLIAASGEDALAILGLTIDFDMTNPEVGTVISNLENKITTINDTAYRRLKTLLRAAYNDGRGQQKLAKDIRDLYTGMKSKQAKVIARTEMGKIYNAAQVIAWNQSGVVTHKKWIATRDSRTRDLHAKQYGTGGYDNEIRKINESFTGGGEMLRYPGDPSGSAANVIQCRCTCAPIANDDPNADLNKKSFDYDGRLKEFLTDERHLFSIAEE